MSENWQEVYEGGSPEVEDATFRELARKVTEIQRKNAAKMQAAPMRTLHAGPIFATTSARFAVNADIPAGLAAGPFQPGASFRAALRLSNASGIPHGYEQADMRGFAIRLFEDDVAIQDFLMTNYPASHARNARQFVEFAEIAAGPRAFVPVKLLFKFGPGETVRMLKNIKGGLTRVVSSIACDSFWSRGALLWGEVGPVRYFVRPMVADALSATATTAVPADLRAELARRLAEPVRYEFCLQKYVDASSTPIEDGAAEWRESVAPPVPVATITIPAMQLGTASATADEAKVEKFAFNPWNCAPGFRPLGNLNRARGMVYGASARGRNADR
jgi:hypothetical protein